MSSSHRSANLLPVLSSRTTARAVAAAIALLLALTAIAPSATAAPTAAPAPIRYLDPVFTGVTVTKDLTYGQSVNDQGQTEVHKLDLYQPTGDTATSRPAVVYIHGGGFVSGGKGQGAKWANDLAKRGYVVVSIDYRLASQDNPRTPGEPPPPYYVQSVYNAKYDAQAAVRWLRANAATYRIDPDHIGATGSSAGAVTSLAIGYTADDPGTSGNPGYSSAVNAVVANSGAVGTDVQTPGDAPALMLNGTADKVADLPEAKASCAAATAAHDWCTLAIFPGVGHTVGAFEPELTMSLTATYFYAYLAPGGANLAAPFPDPVSFVARQYRDLLQRDADPVGLDFWSSRIAHGTNSPAGLVDSFARSPELQGTIGAVTRSYLAYLGRTPDPSGLTYWVGQLRSGRTIASVDRFLGTSDEFVARQQGLTDRQFVDDLYQDVLARAPEPAGEAYWLGRLRAGASRASVVGAFIPLPESVRATAPDVAVSIGAVGLLGRLPTTAEHDHWVPLLRSGTPATDYYASILGSAEYRARITP